MSDAKADAVKPATDPQEMPYDPVDRKTEIWRSKMAKGYQEHAHCIVCGRALHLGKKYCSMECKDKYEGVQKKQGKQQRWMCILMAVVFPVMMIFMMLSQGG